MRSQARLQRGERSKALQNLDLIKEKVRQSINLVELVSEQVALRPSGRSFKGRCPFHDDKTPSFMVTPEKGIFKCFGCGVGGDVFKFVQLAEKVEFMDALRLLADRAGIEVGRLQQRRSGQPSRPDLVRINAWARDTFSGWLLGDRIEAAAWGFLDSRGLTRGTAEQFGLGLAPADGDSLLRAASAASIDVAMLKAAGLVQTGDRGEPYSVFRDRLMFPIVDAMGRVIGFGGRALGDARAKYVNTAQNTLFDKGRNLYGLDQARSAIVQERCAIVVEGYTDCLAAHQHGIHNTVASLGTALTEAQVQLLRRYCGEMILVFDSDDAGEAAADRAVGPALRSGMRVRLARVREGKDPCDYLQLVGAQGFQSALNSAVDALGFKWQRTLAQFRSGDGGDARRAALLEFVRFIADLSRYGALDPIQRGLIVNEIGKVVHASPEEVQRLLKRAESARMGRSRNGGEESNGRTRPAAQAGGEDGQETALCTILEILLNEPSLYATARHVFEPDRIRHPMSRRIAERVRELGEQSEGVRLDGLLGSIESTQEAAHVTDLLFRGEARGDYDKTLRGAVARLEKIHLAQAARRAVENLGQGSQDTQGQQESAVLQQLGDLHRKLAGPGQFASPKLVEEYRPGAGA
jgi:DNA primase